MKKSFAWSEKYRPQTIKECILPDRLKQIFQTIVDTGNLQSMLLFGPPGLGKTTIAQAVCQELNCSWLFINSSEDNGIDVLRTKIRNYASTSSFKGGRKVVILDESDNLTQQAQEAFRGAMEEFESNCIFIFTCNNVNKLIPALRSRNANVDFTLKPDEIRNMAKQFHERVLGILSQEKINFDQKAVAKLVLDFFPDYRRTLNELQFLANNNDKTIDLGVVAALDSNRDMQALYTAMKEKNFANIRQWVADNSSSGVNTVFTKFYEDLNDVFKPTSRPAAIVILAKYQNYAAFVANQEINLAACIVELFLECEVQ